MRVCRLPGVDGVIHITVSAIMCLVWSPLSYPDPGFETCSH